MVHDAVEADDKLELRMMDECELEERKRSKGKQNLLDRISLLPYEVLVSIVSFLSLKEAAATSILSKRWQHLWKNTMSLNFQDVDFSVGDSFHRFQALEQKLIDQKSCEYVKWVDRVLEQHEGHNIERFRAYFFLNRKFKNSIDKWIEFAMEKKVQVLEFQFLIVMSDEVLEYFLSNCPVLERLTVTAAKNVFCTRVVGPSISVKYLTINDCPNLKTIEICTQILFHLSIGGAWIDLLISNLPMLIEILKLNICGVVYNPNFDFPLLENLKQLELNVDTNYHLSLYHLCSFMKACPHIQTCTKEIQLDFRPYVNTTVRKATKFPHHSLKVVEILGYRAHQSSVEHVVYLVENAVALEKIIVDPVRRWIGPLEWTGELIWWMRNWRQESMLRIKHLKERVPSTIELACL
ncbi:putative F-box/LRR-repeat protein At3g18150 [Argentina anserina]|uniref:putative F-box/LRR-repeat protein At3g18150 n=1 Tax=Argentina anserina TaxID=57926 RepID=UPI0021765628|nr:putative F-box/LRR-repeat protein At3g18150 [Potentilla anserina]